MLPALMVAREGRLMISGAQRGLEHVFSGYVKRMVKILQFLIPISSSMRPSYVSCVNKGVIISTCLSRMMRESILSDISRGASGVVELDS